MTRATSPRTSGGVELFDVLDGQLVAAQHPAPAPTVIATIAVGGRPGAIAVSADARYLFVATEGSVKPIRATDHYVTTIPTRGRPQGISLARNGVWGYVPGYDGSVSIINTAHRTVRTVSTKPISDYVNSPDGELFYAAHNEIIDGKHVSWVSATDTDGAKAGLVAVDGYVSGLAISPDGTRLYAATWDQATYYEHPRGAVQMIDVGSGTIETVDVGVSPDTVTTSPDGRRLYVTHYDTLSVSTVDLGTGQVTPILLDDHPIGVTVSPDNRHAVVTSVHSASIIDSAGQGVNHLAVGELPRGAAFSPDGGHIYVTAFGGQSVSVVDTASKTVTSTVYVGGHPEAVAVSPSGRRVYVGDYWSQTVTVIAAPTTTTRLECSPRPVGQTALAATDQLALPMPSLRRA